MPLNGRVYSDLIESGKSMGLTARKCACIIQTIRGVKEEYVSFMKEAGVSMKTSKALCPILPDI